jgi:formylmethanofuran dehydrogenase subunit E
MKERTKLKYKINYNLATYNFKTKQYENKEMSYHTFEQARANQWRCDKCQKLFPTIKELKLHKLEYHSY